MNPADQPLKFEIKGGRVIISIGVDTLAWCTKQGLQGTGQWPKCCGKVTHNEGFCREILEELTREEENGNIPFIELLDKAALDSLDNGNQYVNFLHKGKIDVEGLTELAQYHRKGI